MKYFTNLNLAQLAQGLWAASTVDAVRWPSAHHTQGLRPPRQTFQAVVGICLILFLAACTPEDDTPDAPIQKVELSDDPLDAYIREAFLDPYGVAVRYRFADRYVSPVERVAPVEKDLVRPTLDFLNKFWVQPYLEVANGEDYFRSTVPAEVVLIGSFIFNTDGNRGAGYGRRRSPNYAHQHQRHRRAKPRLGISTTGHHLPRIRSHYAPAI